jgi:TolB-like protein
LIAVEKSSNRSGTILNDEAYSNRVKEAFRQEARMKSLQTLAAVGFLLTSTGLLAAAEKPAALVSVVTRDLQSHFGALGKETETHIEIVSIKSGVGQNFAKTELKAINKDVSESTVINTVGLATYMAWRVRNALPVDSASGKIAQIDGAVVYVSMGKSLGVDVGQELAVYRGKTDIKDPDTGELLGTQRRRVAKLEAIEVSDKLTKAKLIGDLEITLEVGDAVEPSNLTNHVAIFPVVNQQGQETLGARRIAEELTTGLVNRGIGVVERRLLDRVLAEQFLQRNGAFDQAEVRRAGKQLGAYAVVLGSVAPKNKFAEVQFRLVRVETGEILAAASHIIRDISDLLTVADAAGLPALDTGFLGAHTWIGLGVHTKGPSFAKEFQLVKLRIVERQGSQFTATWDWTAYAASSTGMGSVQIKGKINGQSAEWKGPHTAQAQAEDGALLVKWQDQPHFGENVFVSEATFNDNKRFIGRYRIIQDGGFVFDLSLAPDGSATKSHRLDDPGRWQPYSSGVFVVWRSGWRDILLKEAKGFTKSAIAPGSSFTEARVNQGVATKVE